jgi:hypothetical protein
LCCSEEIIDLRLLCSSFSDALSARVWVAQEVGDNRRCWWAVKVLNCLLAVPRMLVGMARARSRALLAAGWGRER